MLKCLGFTGVCIAWLSLTVEWQERCWERGNGMVLAAGVLSVSLANCEGV